MKNVTDGMMSFTEKQVYKSRTQKKLDERKESQKNIDMLKIVAFVILGLPLIIGIMPIFHGLTLGEMKYMKTFFLDLKEIGFISAYSYAIDVYFYKCQIMGERFVNFIINIFSFSSSNQIEIMNDFMMIIREVTSNVLNPFSTLMMWSFTYLRQSNVLNKREKFFKVYYVWILGGLIFSIIYILLLLKIYVLPFILGFVVAKHGVIVAIGVSICILIIIGYIYFLIFRELKKIK